MHRFKGLALFIVPNDPMGLTSSMEKTRQASTTARFLPIRHDLVGGLLIRDTRGRLIGDSSQSIETHLLQHHEGHRGDSQKE